jgi:flagellar hook-associated protein 2
MQQERAPITAIEAQRTTLQAQNSAFATFATKLGALKSAASDLAETTNIAKVSATSSDETAVGVSTGSASVTGRYDVVVSELARAQVTTSSSTYSSLDTIIATSGAISLARVGDPPIEITVTGAMTLQDLAEAINAAQGSPVSASIVQVTPGQYRLVLTGRSTGTANAFTASFSTPVTGGAGLSFADTDGNGVFGDSAADNVQQALDAQLTVNNVAVTSSTNIVDDVIPGVTMTLRKMDAANSIAIDVAKNTDALKTQADAFATALNDLVSFINDQASGMKDGKPGIARDPLVRGLRDGLRSTIFSAQTGSGTFARLGEVGISFDTSGKVSIDKTRLTAALDASATDVAALFADRFGAIDTLVGGYIDAGGLVPDARKRIDTQVASLGSRIDNMEAQLEIRRAALQQEFIAADRAMSQLQAQGSSLSQLGSQYSLF